MPDVRDDRLSPSVGPARSSEGRRRVLVGYPGACRSDSHHPDLALVARTCRPSRSAFSRHAHCITRLLGRHAQTSGMSGARLPLAGGLPAVSRRCPSLLGRSHGVARLPAGDSVPRRAGRRSVARSSPAGTCARVRLQEVSRADKRVSVRASIGAVHSRVSAPVRRHAMSTIPCRRVDRPPAA